MKRTIRKFLAEWFDGRVFWWSLGGAILGFLAFDLLHGTRAGVISDVVLIGLFALTLTIRRLSLNREDRRAGRVLDRPGEKKSSSRS